MFCLPPPCQVMARLLITARAGLMAVFFLALAFSAARQAQTAPATPVYLAPPQTAATGARRGTPEAPFVKLAQAVAAVESGQGDHILLQDGHYGTTFWRNITPARMIRVAAEHPGGAHFDLLHLQKVENLHLIGLSIWPRQPVAKTRSLVQTSAHSANLILDQFDLRGRADANDTYMSWSLEDWLTTWRSSGYRLDGRNIELRNSSATAISFGIQALGPEARILNNTVRGFSGDGLRGIGPNGLFEGNLVQDCFAVNSNHDDGFQSWSPKNNGPNSTLPGLRLIGNVIWEWSGRADHPLQCRLQGIGLFDGFFRDIEIRNNLVVVDHYHGISLYGGIDGVIANNTVLHPNLQPGNAPWISVMPHKKGQPSRNIRVESNVAMSYREVVLPLRKNVKAKVPFRLYRDPARGDFTPSPDGPLAGTALGARLDPALLRRLQDSLSP